ncbi:MAG: RidA family protein [Deltaproteobacteria bacterium]|nr:RidA family protein [Deltaproteobacteria bacterium]
MAKEILGLDAEWDGKMHFSQGVKVGTMVFVSGQGALDAKGDVVGPGDIEAQTRRALQNVEAVLRRAGATLRDVVKVTTFLTQRSSGTVSRYDRVFGEFFPTRCPASTLVEVKSLVLRDMMVEIEAVAIVGAGA